MAPGAGSFQPKALTEVGTVLPETFSSLIF
jgi:hypothetical protein